MLRKLKVENCLLLLLLSVMVLVFLESRARTLTSRKQITVTLNYAWVWKGEMKRTLRSDWLPDQARWEYLSRSGSTASYCKKRFCFCCSYNKSFIGQSRRSRWFLTFLWRWTSSRSITTKSKTKQKMAQHLFILAPRLITYMHMSITQLPTAMYYFCKFSARAHLLLP